MTGQIDTAKIRSEFDFWGYVSSLVTLRPVSGSNGEWMGPCPICGEGEDRFRIQPEHPDGARWLCHICLKDAIKWQDPISFVMRHRGLSFVDACKWMTGQPSLPLVEAPAPAPTMPAEPFRMPLSPTAEWQSMALQTVAKCATFLQEGVAWLENPEGPEPKAAKVARWLLDERGLTPVTLRNAMIGFNPDWRQVSPDHKLPPGVVIPSFFGPELHLWYVQVRVDKATSERYESKYICLKGSILSSIFVAGSYPRLWAARYAIVVEGEFDALLLSQFVPDNFAVITMGSATRLPSEGWQLYLAHLHRVWVFADRDEAGAAALQRWLGLSDMYTPMPAGPELGQDVTDWWRAGGDLAGWVARALDDYLNS